jgi:hypothetical protein
LVVVVGAGTSVGCLVLNVLAIGAQITLTICLVKWSSAVSIAEIEDQEQWKECGNRVTS